MLRVYERLINNLGSCDANLQMFWTCSSVTKQWRMIHVTYFGIACVGLRTTVWLEWQQFRLRFSLFTTWMTCSRRRQKPRILLYLVVECCLQGDSHVGMSFANSTTPHRQGHLLHCPLSLQLYYWAYFSTYMHVTMYRFVNKYKDTFNASYIHPMCWCWVVALLPQLLASYRLRISHYPLDPCNSICHSRHASSGLLAGRPLK